MDLEVEATVHLLSSFRGLVFQCKIPSTLNNCADFRSLTSDFAMRFTPHYTETRGNSRPHLNPEPSDLTDAKLHVSGSHWGLSHLYALRVVLLESLPIERIIPAAYVPTPGSHGKQQLRLLLSNTVLIMSLRFHRPRATYQTSDSS